MLFYLGEDLSQRSNENAQKMGMAVVAQQNPSSRSHWNIQNIQWHRQINSHDLIELIGGYPAK